jgi:hypothetical protein
VIPHAPDVVGSQRGGGVRRIAGGVDVAAQHPDRRGAKGGSEVRQHAVDVDADAQRHP